MDLAHLDNLKIDLHRQYPQNALLKADSRIRMHIRIRIRNVLFSSPFRKLAFPALRLD